MPVNRLLLDVDRVNYQSRIDEMFKLCPDIMSRKISLANVQQAFIFDAVMNYYEEGHKLLCVGSFEDSVSGSLQGDGIQVTDIDPSINYSLHTFRDIATDKFDIIFATSVIEHEINDEVFIGDMCSLLNFGGYGILTTDFNDKYKVGDPLPRTVLRQYTSADMARLRVILQQYNCDLVDEPDYSGESDFIYQGHLYAFASFVFKKK